MTAEQILIMIMPLIIWGVTWITNKITPYFGTANGLIIVSVIVPALSAISVWILGLIQPGTEWYLQFIYNFAAVFANELVKAIKKALGIK